MLLVCRMDGKAKGSEARKTMERLFAVEPAKSEKALTLNCGGRRGKAKNETPSPDSHILYAGEDSD